MSPVLAGKSILECSLHSMLRRQRRTSQDVHKYAVLFQILNICCNVVQLYRQWHGTAGGDLLCMLRYAGSIVCTW